MTAKLKDSLYPVTFALGFLILWELAVRLLSVPMYLLPSPTQVVSAIDGSLWSHTLVTLGESLTGFMLANILGLVTAVIFVHSKPIEKGMFRSPLPLRLHRWLHWRRCLSCGWEPDIPRRSSLRC